MSLLTFPATYFEAEVRSNYPVEPMMKRCWAAQLEVLAEIDRVCKRHKIRYFADWGTLLGAVRHNGYIPWDDDLDITMFRQDLLQFLKVAKKELPKGFEVLNIFETPDYDQEIVRVTNSMYINPDDAFTEKYHGFPFAAGLDIFPLDYIPKEPEERDLQISLISIVSTAANAWMQDPEAADEPETFLEERDKLTREAEEVLNTKLDRNGNMVNQLYKLQDALCALYGPEDSDTVGIVYRQLYDKDRVPRKIEWFDSAIDHPFEITTIPIPVGYEEILKLYYGNYKQEVFQVAHDYPCYKRQMKILEKHANETGQYVNPFFTRDTQTEQLMKKIAAQSIESIGIYVAPKILDIRREKEDELRDDYLRLDMNENPEGLPEDFVREVRQEITGEFLATYPNKERLRKKIAEREDLSPSQVTLLNGSDEGIRLLYEVFVRPHGRAVFVVPTFAMYQIYPQMRDMETVTIPYDENFHLDFDALLAAITKETDVLVLLNPNSPIGGEYTEEEYTKILTKAKENGVLVFIDEAYYPFGVNTKRELLSAYPNVVISRTFSKLCSLAGARVGYLLGNSTVISMFENAESTFNVNSIGLLFAERLLDRPELLEELIKIEEEGKNYLSATLRENGYTFHDDCGNYILFLPKKLPAAALAYQLKEKKRILVKTYGNPLLAKYIRVTTGSRAVMEQFTQALLELDA